MRNSKISIKPLVVRNKDQDAVGVIGGLAGMVLTIVSYPILINYNSIVFYSSIICFSICIVIHSLFYLTDSERDKIVFKMDEHGIFFHNKRPHSFEWQDLKEVSVRYLTNEKGEKNRMLIIITQSNREYRLDIFKFVLSNASTIRRMKELVDSYSQGTVSFKNYPYRSKKSS